LSNGSEKPKKDSVKETESPAPAASGGGGAEEEDDDDDDDADEEGEEEEDDDDDDDDGDGDAAAAFLASRFMASSRFFPPSTSHLRALLISARNSSFKLRSPMGRASGEHPWIPCLLGFLLLKAAEAEAEETTRR
jgi:hypothetical protein